jgi:NTE family protein
LLLGAFFEVQTFELSHYGLCMTHRAFVAFAGGGAKGIIHVGALRALEEREVRFIGVAGTSAGAIIATLVAAGFRSKELVDTESGATVMDALREIDPKLRRATDLFGRLGWWRIAAFRLLSRQPLSVPLLLLLVWALPLAAILGIITLPLAGAAWLWIAVGWAATGIALWVFARSLIGGLADISRFRNALAILLQRRLFPNEPARVVKMSDFGTAARPPLKIVSANLTRRTLQLFSAERTPETAVADAVAASICLPVIFRPWTIGEDLYVDGAIVSNLPAWPFDEERELDPEALTIAVEIESRPDQRKLGRFNWVPALLPTAMFGSGELNIRVAGPAEQLALPTTFELLDFDKGVRAAVEEVGEVALAAGVRLDKRLFRLPEIYRNACQVAQALALDGLGLPPAGQGSDPRVRVAVGRLERGYVHSLRLTHSVGFDSDTDEALLVPLDGSVAGVAWRAGESVFEPYPLPYDRDLPGDANRLRRKARWPLVKWVMCIPILDEESGVPRLLVQLDGNTDLPSNAETATALEGVEEAVKDFFNLVLHELKELEDDHGA